MAATRPRPADALSLGIDLGTSGCRAALLDAHGHVQAFARTDLPPAHQAGPLSEQDPHHWWQALCATTHALLTQLTSAPRIEALCVDGTSGSVLAVDGAGEPLGPALMYDDQRAREEAQRLATVLAAAGQTDSPSSGAGSGLARILWLRARYPDAAHFLHQADWLTGRLMGDYGHSDENNALKSGYDPVARRWPDWLAELALPESQLPRVHPPGTRIGRLSAEAARATGLPAGLPVAAGTTDSTAAFLATGAHRPGEAVTSLGSTLVLKVLAERPVVNKAYGVYSQRLGDLWLVGGASNSGGAVLRAFFSDADMARLTPQLDADTPTGLDYYPLHRPGERFPFNDPELAPRLAPRPADDARFFQGLLEGLAQIEYTGYRRLAELGAPWPVNLRTVGGGSRNPAWTRIRQRLLGVPFVTAEHDEAACGAARLAQRALTTNNNNG
ncbi:MAG TPA: carbohydrate kinase [Gammaproteobacteria bacterium]|nr:carbohydrate kinase [Gammaproteobacteria bacterium]